MKYNPPPPLHLHVTCAPPHARTWLSFSRTSKACEDSTVMLLSLARPAMGTKAVELGSGYGSGSRYLAANFGATVHCVDLSQEANDLNRRLTEEAGLSPLVKVSTWTCICLY